MDDQKKAFLAAAEKGLEDVIRKELQGRNRRLLIAAEDSQGRGPVHLAAKGGQQQVIRLLHDHGVLLEVLDCNGWTPLHLACEHGRLEAASVLLERGCQADAQDTFGRTPLHLAVCSQDSSLCRLLLSANDNLAERCDQSGRSPLAYAVLNSSPLAAEECVRLLLQSLAEPNRCDSFGLAPLHYAAEGGRQGVAQLLLAKAADPLLRDPNSGRIPLEFASLESMQDLLQDASRKQLESQSASEPVPGDLQVCPAFAFRNTRFQAMQSRFIEIMKDVQASSIQQRQHLLRPSLFDASWMAGVHTHQQLLGSELATVQGPEACIRVFNLLYPPSQDLQDRVDDEDIAAYFAGMWDGKEAGLPVDRRPEKDPGNDFALEELSEHKEALKMARTELQEANIREMRLNAELQAALQDGAIRAEKEAHGEGTHTLGHRVLRAGRQLAQKTEELRSAQALGQKLHRESSMFQEELQEAKQQTTELQVEQIETQKRLEKELLRRGEEKSWKLIAEEEQCRAEVVRAMLERRLEEAEVAALHASRGADVFREDAQRQHMEEAQEVKQLRQHLLSEEAEAQRLRVSSEEVLVEAQQALEAKSASYHDEIHSARRGEERERQLAEKIQQGQDACFVLEEEVATLKEAARQRDAQWRDRKSVV